MPFSADKYVLDFDEKLFTIGINGKSKIQLIHNDITSEPVEAITNAANRALKHGGGVAKAICFKAGGMPFQQESDAYIKKYGYLKEGGCGYTSAGKLPAPCKYVIHAVGPYYN